MPLGFFPITLFTRPLALFACHSTLFTDHCSPAYAKASVGKPPWALLHLAGQVGQHVEAVNVDLEGLVPGLVPLQKLGADIRFSGRGQESRKPVLVGDDAVEHRASFELARNRSSVINKSSDHLSVIIGQYCPNVKRIISIGYR